jgi:hypothetical protein
MDEDPDRKGSFDRAMAVISGCQTREQLDNARNYVRNYCESFGVGSECDDLWAAVKKTDARLFPSYPEVI